MSGFWLACVLKSAVVLGIAPIVALLLRRASASVRHQLWVGVFLVLVMLPLGQAMLPGWAIHLPAHQELAGAAPVTAASTSAGVAPVDMAHGAASFVRSRSAPTFSPSSPTLPRLISAPSPPQTGTSLAFWLLIGWAAGALTLMIYQGVGWLLAARLVRRARQDSRGLIVAPSVAAALSGVRFEIGIGPAEPSVPITCGLFRPTIVLPDTCLDWPQDTLESILLHEAAHVRRRDIVWQSLAALVCALHWFNPLVWIAAKRLRAEAEFAADDAVLADGRVPSAYAQALVRLAADHRRRLLPVSGVTAMNTTKIERRIEAILQPARSRKGAGSLSTILVAALTIAFVFGLGGARLARAQAESHSVSASVQGEDPGDPRLNQQVTFTSSRADARRALSSLNKLSPIRIDPAIKGAVNLPATKVALHSALDLITSQLDATWMLVDGAIAVTKQGQSSVDSVVPSFRASEEDIRVSIQHLMKAQKLRYTIAPGVQGYVTLDSKKESVRAILDTLCKQVKAAWRVESGVIEVMTTEGLPPLHDRHFSSWTPKPVEFRRMVTTILAMNHVRCLIDPEVQGKVITTMTGVTLDTFLDKVCPQVDATWNVEQGVVHIRPIGKGGPLDQLVPYFEARNEQPDVALRDLLKRSGIEVTVSPQIDRTVTVQTTNLPLRNVLDYICQSLNAKWSFSSGTVKVFPADYLLSLDSIVPDFEAEQLDIRTAVQKLLSPYHVPFRVDSSVQGTVALSLKNVKMSTALDNLSRQVAATWKIQSGAVVVSRPSEAQALDRIMPSFEFANADVREAFRQVFRSAGLSYTIDPAVQGTVTTSMRSVTVRTLLDNTCRLVDATWKVQAGVVVVTRQVHAVSNPNLDTVVPSLEFDNADAREALRQVFRSAGLSYSIDPAVQGTLTASMKNVTVRTLLDNLCRQVDSKWQLDGGVVKVSRN